MRFDTRFDEDFASRIVRWHFREGTIFPLSLLYFFLNIEVENRISMYKHSSLNNPLSGPVTGKMLQWMEVIPSGSPTAEGSDAKVAKLQGSRLHLTSLEVNVETRCLNVEVDTKSVTLKSTELMTKMKTLTDFY